MDDYRKMLVVLPLFHAKTNAIRAVIFTARIGFTSDVFTERYVQWNMLRVNWRIY